MTTKSDNPASFLREQTRNVLSTALHAHRNGRQKIHQSLKNVSETIGTQYGNRVLFELIQNAHDAHKLGESGSIAIKLITTSDTKGELLVANKGCGFLDKDVSGITNIAISGKKVGEGIGNKGLGFRSVEAITDDVRIYSRRGRENTGVFDGYCFRFAHSKERERTMLRGLAYKNISNEEARKIAPTIPRYLTPVPLGKPPEEIARYAKLDYASVVVAPLNSDSAIQLAREQMEAIANLEVPLLLFLDRISDLRIEVKIKGERQRGRRLTRRQLMLQSATAPCELEISQVDVGDQRRFLVVRQGVSMNRIQEAVDQSIKQAPALQRWKDWRGQQPTVSIAVGLSGNVVLQEGQLYNFLPMAREAHAPLLGYVDAPFFADIDRRNVNLNLPLNSVLMNAVAETCLAGAQAIVEKELSVPALAVFDLVAWMGEQAPKFDQAVMEATKAGLEKLPLIPIIPTNDGVSWSSIEDVTIWPNAKFSLLKPREVVKHVDVHLVSEDLDDIRLTRLQDMAGRSLGWGGWLSSRLPAPDEISSWSTLYAQSLLERKAKPATWAKFYKDLVLLCEKSEVGLEYLNEETIFLDQKGKLQQAGGHDEENRKGIYIRKGERRKKSEIPLPPSSLAKGYLFFDEKIKLPEDVLKKFLNAGLLREFEPLEALSSLKGAMGKKPTERKRMDALDWAFRVWRGYGDNEELGEALASAELHVPATAGWLAATEAIFSGSWTGAGKRVENYLIGSSGFSKDCREARSALLKPLKDWPTKSDESLRRWRQFLEAIKVTDGLKPLAADVEKSASASVWHHLLREGRSQEGLDKFWLQEVQNTFFYHPRSYYQLKGGFWRFPGQIEYNDMPEHMRKIFCELVVEHLKNHQGKFLSAQIGRYDPGVRSPDEKLIATPLGVFLRSADWLLADIRGDSVFRKPGECWAKQGGGTKIPKFIAHLSDSVRTLIDHEDLASFSLGKDIGLLDWTDPKTAPIRLTELAKAADHIQVGDATAFRQEYKRAWKEIIETGDNPPSDLSLVVDRRNGLKAIRGDVEKPISVIIASENQKFEVRALIAADRAVLEVEETQTKNLEEILRGVAGYAPKLLDGNTVQLLIDDLIFAPRADDPPLTSCGLDWLPEVAIIANELLGERLERGILREMLDKKIRRLRVRRCNKIALMDGDENLTPLGQRMDWHAVDDDEFPTLILANELSLNWRLLADELANDISRLVHSNLRSLEHILLKLALKQPADSLRRPSDEDLAKALGRDISAVKDMRAVLRGELTHMLHLLFPVVGYFAGPDAARSLITASKASGFDVVAWLTEHLPDNAPEPRRLVKACEESADRRAIGQTLGLAYGKLNRVLQKLGEETLGREDEMNSVFNAHLAEMRSSLVDQLRRLHFDDYQTGQDLSLYLDRKELGFIPFVPEWLIKFETLELQTVAEHVKKVVAKNLGNIPEIKLPPYKKLVEENRKMIRNFASDAAPIVGAWSRQNGGIVPESWRGNDPQEVVLLLENAGLLDFERLDSASGPGLCRRVGIWPEGMGLTIDKKRLGLKEKDVQEETKRFTQERNKQEIRRRTVQFAGSDLDTGDRSFAVQFQKLAEDFVSRDDSWYERSQRARLDEMGDLKRSTRAETSGRANGGNRREPQLSEPKKSAMGLASEWLAFEYLKRRFNQEAVDERAWVSTNRSRFFGGGRGDDAAGYDFLVQTPSAKWMFEVKSNLEHECEFELTHNEIQVASTTSRSRRYRILYVPYVFSPEKWHVLELPNPMDEKTRSRFLVIREGSVRFRFERR